MGKRANTCFSLHRLDQSEVLGDVVDLHLAVPGTNEDELLGEMNALGQVALHVEGQVEGLTVEDIHVLVRVLHYYCGALGREGKEFCVFDVR